MTVNQKITTWTIVGMVLLVGFIIGICDLKGCKTPVRAWPGRKGEIEYA